MGFGFHASNTLKENRALLKKRKSYQSIRDMYDGCLKDSELKFKELSDFEKKKIRDKIITQAKKDKQREVKIYILSFILVLPIIVFFIWVFLSYLK